MPTFFMFGKYSAESMRGISAKRTQEVNDIVDRFGGEILAMYALMGAYDLVLITNFANMENALKASVTMSQALGISFSTLPAIPVEEFDKLLGK
jgi:uncharacterized protein with GYD domain